MSADRLVRKWEVDDDTVVEARRRAGRKIAVTVNGAEIPARLKLAQKTPLQFQLADGRNATVTSSRQLGGAQMIDLRVNGQLMMETGKTPPHCPSCKIAVKPNDRFCDSCGAALLSAEYRKHAQQVKTATTMIWAVAALFAISAIAFFFLRRATTTAALHELDGLPPDSIYPKLFNGHSYTVATLRQMIAWEPWGVFLVNLVLAAVMAGLALWSRRAPLPAVLVAAATYLVVLVTGGLMDPETIARGAYLKMIVILALSRGIKSAFALRAQTA